MGTRGMYGIRKDETDKCTYNHFDSYPEYLGRKIVQFCADRSPEEISALYDKITMVDETDRPDSNQWETLAHMGVERSDIDEQNDWYSTLRGFQGDLEKLYQASSQADEVFMTEGGAFILDSLFCEYAYIINLDTSMLEFWLGSQREPDLDNRYGIEKDEMSGYYPCRLGLCVPLRSIYDGDPSVEEAIKKMLKTARNRTKRKG